MSWQAVSFLILAGGLLAGFAWYERSRPPSQVVAMVAALAALAIAGRIAFAAFPNVKPTTDIVIFAGYALGGAPGFAVGAFTGLVSNFWFGQGPWTPWQMAGWGLCGVLGAAVGLGWRNVGRFGLAAICGFAAIFYGALLNFSLMATYGGQLSWQTFVLYEGRAVPFEIAHVAGNVVFALLAGPAMLRMLVRFRERFEWRRAAGDPGRGDGGSPPAGRRAPVPGLRGGAALGLVLLVLAAISAAPAHAAGDLRRAADWLRSVQNEDGGFPSSPGERSGAETTGWAMLGLEAAGINPLDVRSAGRSPVDFLRTGIAAMQKPGDIARTILALEGAGVDPRDFGGHNLLERLRNKRRKDGSYEEWPGSTSFAVLALRAGGATGGLERTLKWLNAAQNQDGGWGDVPGGPSSADNTAAALQALTPGSRASKRGLDYLRKVQRKGGGFPLGGNGELNTQSTAWAIQGIIAAGADPQQFRKGASAAEYLAARQAGDGHYRYSKSSDQTPTWVTAEAMAAVAGKPFPLSPVPRAKPKATPEPNSSSTTTTEANTTAPVPSSGISPTPSSSLPGPEPSSSTSGQPSAGGGRGGSAGHSGPSAPAAPSVSPNQATGGASGAASTTAAPAEAPASGEPEEAPATSENKGSGGTSALGAVVAGLLAGALIFGLIWGARRGWMRWRYGL
ncbi:MAG: prenyltransferase/squalene oxidase repeat-containing protein [Solirubrobacterales bacterium]